MVSCTLWLWRLVYESIRCRPIQISSRHIIRHFLSL